ncbi:MAG: hypothetical protein Q4G30_08925 [Actinomycetaceae bacterium]|nr:hypothetical protein [Actinomycetaceae bacterium]
MIQCFKPSVVTQSKTLAGVSAEITPILAEIVGVSEAEVELEIDLVLPKEFKTSYASSKKYRIQADEAAKKASEASRNAVAVLANSGISTRDIGSIMGISAQRVSQLAHR